MRCLLCVHAHPDDEASKGPGTVARYHDEGVRCVLVCATGGEEGDILNPAMEHVRDNVAEVRKRELEHAAEIIGYDELVWLGYRDSGMPDSPANKSPEAFANAPLDEAAERLVKIIRRVRPQVIVTYPKVQTEYPHPDHIRVYEVTKAAWDRAGDPLFYPDAGEPFSPSKMYYTMWPRQRMKAMHEKFLELDIPSPFDEKWLERIARADDPVSTSIDITGFGHIRGDALLAHATQVDPKSPFWFGLPKEVLAQISPYDDYLLGESRLGSTDVKEDDLFCGITGTKATKEH